MPQVNHPEPLVQRIERSGGEDPVNRLGGSVQDDQRPTIIGGVGDDYLQPGPFTPVWSYSDAGGTDTLDWLYGPDNNGGDANTHLDLNTYPFPRNVHQRDWDGHRQCTE